MFLTASCIYQAGDIGSTDGVNSPTKGEPEVVDPVGPALNQDLDYNSIVGM